MDKQEIKRRALICANDYDGIVPYFEAFYIHSIIYSASRCLDSFQRYEAIKEKDVSADELISILQEAVGHSAALSRYFWPSPIGKKKHSKLSIVKEKWGKKLRIAFNLDDNSVLYNRELRNAWEHFDERLDCYFIENDAGYFFPSCIVGSHQLADDPAGHIFKLLDIKEECLVLLGTKFFFSPIKESVKKVLEKAMEADKQGARL
ncbi:MAG TPA: hypothetical protein QF468_06800 [Nitrospinota bacterium]|nr:hypothetical protein [Nitrospinota bacterium]